MNPTDFLDSLERLLTNLSRYKSKVIISPEQRNQVRSFVGAWFEQYRKAFVSLIADEDLFSPIDDAMNTLVKLASDRNSRRVYKHTCKALQTNFRNNLLVPLSRAYWSRAPEAAMSGRDPDVAKRLRCLDDALAESYEQVIEDLSDEDRKTYRGTASELREVLRGVLDLLASDDNVMRMEWYKDARRSGSRKEPKPTQAEKTKYILRQRNAGSAAVEAAESYMESVEDRLGHVVRASYRRASDSTHAGVERAEVVQQVKYVNALLSELLPSDGQQA